VNEEEGPTVPRTPENWMQIAEEHGGLEALRAEYARPIVNGGLTVKQLALKYGLTTNGLSQIVETLEWPKRRTRLVPGRKHAVRASGWRGTPFTAADWSAALELLPPSRRYVDYRRVAHMSTVVDFETLRECTLADWSAKSTAELLQINQHHARQLMALVRSREARLNPPSDVDTPASVVEVSSVSSVSSVGIRGPVAALASSVFARAAVAVLAAAGVGAIAWLL
jgi:hypothetical protein